MESGNQLQARFGLVAVLYEFTWWGTGECGSRRAVPEPCRLLFPWQKLGSSGALPTAGTRAVLGFVGGSVVL